MKIHNTNSYLASAYRQCSDFEYASQATDETTVSNSRRRLKCMRIAVATNGLCPIVANTESL